MRIIVIVCAAFGFVRALEPCDFRFNNVVCTGTRVGNECRAGGKCYTVPKDPIAIAKIQKLQKTHNCGTSGLNFVTECYKVAPYDGMRDICKRGDFHPYPNDCHKGIYCINGNPYFLICPDGLAWNKEGRCVWPQLSNC